jgi:hypothetical protein
MTFVTIKWIIYNIIKFYQPIYSVTSQRSNAKYPSLLWCDAESWASISLCSVSSTCPKTQYHIHATEIVSSSTMRTSNMNHNLHHSYCKPHPSKIFQNQCSQLVPNLRWSLSHTDLKMESLHSTGSCICVCGWIYR